MNAEERAKLLKVLQGRFEKNMQRHKVSMCPETTLRTGPSLTWSS